MAKVKAEKATYANFKSGLNPKYAIDNLLCAEITSKSVTSLLFSTLPVRRQSHHSDGMLNFPRRLIF
tara:strand:- start:4084 stop:4284 length:201 start_codon:yes stop_codon:yes gene_type:complete